MSVYDVPGVADSDGEVNKVLEPGIYPGRIENCSWKKIEKEGSDYNGAMMLMYGVSATDPATGVGSMANDSIILPCEAMSADQSRRALAKLKRLQTACGLEDMGNQIDNEAFLYAEVQVELYIKDDPTYGKQNKIKDILPQ